MFCIRTAMSPRRCQASLPGDNSGEFGRPPPFKLREPLFKQPPPSAPLGGIKFNGPPSRNDRDLCKTFVAALCERRWDVIFPETPAVPDRRYNRNWLLRRFRPEPHDQDQARRHRKAREG